MAIELNASNFDNTIKEGITVVDFWAPWCGPCRMLSPIIDELYVEYKDKAKICKVNTDEEQDIGVRFGIRSIPTVLIFKDGNLVDTVTGMGSKNTLMNKINAQLN